MPALGLPPPSTTWVELSAADPWLGCATVGELPWCRLRAEVSAPLARVDAVLADFEGYARRTFPSVASAEVLAPEVVRLVVDLPFPLADRDYVSHYVRAVEGSSVLYRFAPADALPPVEGVVRLPNVAGEWRLTPTPGGTLVEYTWESDLGGDFPAWALDRAHLTQAREMMAGLSRAAR